MPKVSIIVPCYNQGDYLSETLDSILSQTFKDWECIIINDGSTDNTQIVAAEYCNKDSRFKYIYQMNAGVIEARNNAILHSHGEYILPLDGDDLITSKLVEKAVEVLEKDHNIKLVCSDVEFMGDKTGIVSVPNYSPTMLLQANCFTNTSMYRREDYDRVGGYNPNMKYGFEDWDFWIAILDGSTEKAVRKLHFTGLYYRIINKNTNRNKKAMDYRAMMRQQIFKNHPTAYYQDYIRLIDFYNTITSSSIYIFIHLIKKITNKFLSRKK